MSYPNPLRAIIRICQTLDNVIRALDANVSDYIFDSNFCQTRSLDLNCKKRMAVEADRDNRQHSIPFTITIP